MAGLLKVAAFFGTCTALAAVLIAWYLKEDFDPESVRGKKVVICGASTGIGEELAYQYAKLGAQLLLVARREEALKKVVIRCGELGAQIANYVVADLSSLKGAKRLAAVIINSCAPFLDELKFGFTSLGVRTCESFLCFVDIVRVRVYYLDFLALRHW